MSGLLGGGGKSQHYTAPMEASLRVSTSAYGLALPIVYGTNRVPANMIWYGAFKAIPHTTTTSGGGKGGGGGSSSSTTYTYTASMALALSEGPIVGVNALWKDKEYFNGNTLFSVFNGGYEQSPWSYLTSKFPAQALNYRGVAYVAAADYDLSDSSSTPNHSFEVQGIGLQDWDSPDVRPEFILRDYLTNADYGAGYPEENLYSWTQFDDYTCASGLLFSPAVDAARPANEFITEMMKLTNSGIYYSEGYLKITPYGDQPASGHEHTYTPELTPVYELTDNDFISNGMDDPVVVRRGSQSDAYNQVQVEFVNRANQYNVEIAEAKDQANIETFGLRPLDSIKAHSIADATVARKVAQLILQRSLYVRNTYEFKLGAKFCLLEPTDYVTITDTTLDIVDRPVRIVEIEENDDYTFSIRAEDAPYGVSSEATYESQGSDGHTNEYNVTGGDTADPLIFTAPAQLTTTGLEVWMGAYGADANWGGCEVWASYDGDSYQRIGIINAPARMGVLTAALAAGSDPDTTHTLAVNMLSHQPLTSASQIDADNYATISYVDGEFIAYETATLTSSDNYNLAYLRRGGYGTSNALHAIGSTFCRLDGAILKMTFTPDKVGKTLHLKFPSFNVYGAALQALADVNEYTHTITAAISRPDDVSGLTASFDYPNVTLKWSAAAATSNVRQYIIKRGASWAAATTLATVSGDQSEFTTAATGIGSFTFWIAAVDDAGVQSLTPQYATLTIDQIPALTGLDLDAGFASAFLKYTQPSRKDFAGVQVFMSTTSGFTPSAGNKVYDGPDTLIVLNKDAAGMPLSSSNTYYIKAAGYSRLGTTSLDYSSELAVTPIDITVDIPPNSITSTEIADDSISTPKLQALAITADKIAANAITASKIVAGTITGDKLTANTVTADKIDSRSLTIKDAGGTVIFSAGVALTGTYIADAAITNAKISGAIQSSDYSAGTAGWKIDKSGAAELNNATFRGTLNIRSASTGARVEMTNSVIKVYDGAGVLRVKIGDLSA